MKNKSTRHKDENTFKFQPFAERISNINIDIFHKVYHEYEAETEEGESYFHQAIKKWNVLNLTEGYDKFKKDIKSFNYITLPQVLLGKDHIIKVLLIHLKEKDPLYLQPVLEVVIAVAQDLQKEFYPFYQQFFEIILELLNTKNTEQLEWIFQCLANLFKILWRPMIKNINVVFTSLLPLLSENKPEYINEFAAESFAFVTRKVKDKSAFLELLLKSVLKRKDAISGCGKLLFQVINGVDGQFHNCTEQFLPFYFDFLYQSHNNSTDTWFEILEKIIENISIHIHYQKNKLLWDVLIKNLTKLEDKYKNNDQKEITVKNFEYTLKLIGQLIEFKNGKLLLHSNLVIEQLIKLFSLTDPPDELLIILMQVSISILLSKTIRIAQEQASQLVRKILSIEKENILLYFVDNVNSCSLFETLVLPNFLRRCGLYEFSKNCIFSLTKLILKKSPLSGSGINLKKWTKYSLNFKELKPLIYEKVFECLEFDDEKLEMFFCALICLPHIEFNLEQKKLLVDKLKNQLNFCIGIVESDNAFKFKQYLFWINLIVETIIHLEDFTVIEEFFPKLFTILIKYASNINYVSSLKSLSLIFTVLNSEHFINMEILLQLHEKLEHNFNSPYHELRLLTAYIYSLFEPLNEFDLRHSDNLEVPVEKFKVFNLIYEVELIEPLVQTYRDQLHRLEKLTFDKPQMLMCNQTKFKFIPLRYFCGALFINFKLLWEPINKILETHAYGLESAEFWSIFGVQLKEILPLIKNPPTIQIEALNSEFEALQDVYEQFQRVEDKPDFINYRMLLWKALGSFPDVAEAKTRDVAQLLLTFVEDEYTKSNAETATMTNIKIFSSTDDDNDEENPEILEDKKSGDSKGGKIGRKVMILTLQNKLNVFAQFKSPKSMFREADLYRLYFNLLKHKNFEIQKCSLNCLMTYKFKYLTPYKEHLFNLIDEKNFRNEISNFRVDKESAQIISEHREGLIPIILQIMYSKMTNKTGLRTGGKASSQNRRNLILRFLAGCEEQEMLIFVRKAFEIYEKYLQDNEMDLVSNIVQIVDLERVISPKKLMSTVNLLNIILDQFGGLMGHSLITYLLKILFTIGGLIKGVLNQSDKIHSGYFAVLRNLRTSVIKTLERFFEQFTNYPWSMIQINALFDVFVWPYLDKLNIEGIHSPTNLLKLIKQWGSHPRYFKLLVKHKDDDQTQYIMPHLFNLLINEKSHITVINVIYEIIESLLKYEAAEDDVEIPVDNLIPLESHVIERRNLNGKLNYGSCILLLHIPKILEKIKKKLETKSLNKTELFILCRISELVWESEISDAILHLLMPVVLKRCTLDEDVVIQLLTTVNNLLQNVQEPQVHLRNLTPLFGEVTYPSCRKVLIKILNHMAKLSNNLLILATIVGELNAYDAKWIDQPDYDKRHEAFKKIKEYEADSSFGSLLIFNLFFIVKNEKDLALKDNASHSLKTLCTVLLRNNEKNPKDIDYLLNGCIFSLIKNGMRILNNPDFRNECLALLGCLARECPDVHFVLRDLNKFSNKIDLEVDFFENLTHLQYHRHARAMNKFCAILRESTTSLNPKTITQFLLPIATHYLCTEKYSGKNAVIDGAIDMIGVLCKIIPWHQYEGVLKFALSKLRYKVEFQKQMVRVVVAILDGFHFDLSKGYIEKNALKIVAEVDVEIKESMSEEVEDFNADDTVVEDDEEEINENDENLCKIIDKTSVLCKSTATRVIKTIQNVLLPQLNKSLAELTNYDSAHKLNRKRTGAEREEEDLARVPISLAVVKLLQRLPKEILDSGLPGVFLKLCTFLKSHLESVRRITRETLQKIMISLGPKYLGMLIGEISPLMNRGFQVHVLVFTVHGVLSSLKEFYAAEDIDKVLLTVLNLCTADLFGILSEEKEVVKITAKVSEAKSTKSYDTLQILAQNMTEKCFMDIISPIKQCLDQSHSFKTTKKAQDALRHIALGLIENKFISIESLLKFAYGTASQRIAELLPGKNKKKFMEKVETPKTKILREDCFIIAKIPGNRTSYRQLNVKTSANTNSHLLVEFGLRLCYLMLKREKIKNDEYKPFVDPFVVILKNCLKSKHVKLCSLALQCLQWIMKYDIPSMKQHIKKIIKEIFAILHKFAASGLSKGDNFDLVLAAFKTMAVVVRDVQYYTIDTNQLKVLLMYVEQDMHDYDRQATAFSLLKAIISRKLIVEEIHDVIVKVAELSITSELEHIRAQARSVFHQFIMEYPLGDAVEKYLSFYISQLSYDMQYGRESAIEMINLMINSFPINVLKTHSSTLLITLGARLVNDEVPECRKMIAECLSALLIKLPKKERDNLFEILTLWFKDKEISHRRLAAQLCGIFVAVEKYDFETRLSVTIPLILKQFGLTDETPGKFVKIHREKEVVDEDYQRLKDHNYYQVFQLILKLCTYCKGFLKNSCIENLAYHTQNLLGYPHDWVRLGAAQFLGYILSTMDIENLTMLLLENKTDTGYLKQDPETSIKSLTLDLCDQLQPGNIRSDLAEQVIKNLVFIARVLQKIPNSNKQINLLWLCKRMRKIVNNEVIDNNSNTTLRMEIFKWIAGVVTALEKIHLKPIMHHLLAPLVREMITTEEKNAPLRQLSKDVANLIKKKFGIEEYTKNLQRLQQTLTVKRAERKRERTQLAVTDPEEFAKKKIKIHAKKKLTKKRKIEEIRGKKSFKRRKVIDLEDNSEVM